jgi:predicted alpha/beta-hydrolase family hydrolase
MTVERIGHGFLHKPDSANGDGLVLTHGAGGNCTATLLVKVAKALAEQGFSVLRFDLAFRQKRPSGPPSTGSHVLDQASIREAVATMRGIVLGRVYMGGQSYGGRQATMLAAEDSSVAEGLLLLSYPLHAPGKTQMRTQHFPSLQTPALFVQGDKDPFATPDEIRTAIALIPSATALSIVQGAGHDLKRGNLDVAAYVLEPFRKLIGTR